MTLQTKFTHEWIKGARGIKKPPRPEVTVKSQSWGRLRNNLSIHGSPFCLGGRTFGHGLGTHADSELAVSLPAPGSTFVAVVGVDSNAATQSALVPCKLEFSVLVGEKTLWTSPVLGVEDDAVEVEVDLGGAVEFVLKVRDVNGTMPFAHADWADARVVLENGESLWLTREGRETPNHPPISFEYGEKAFPDNLSDWTHRTESVNEANGTTLHRTTYTEPNIGLECLVEITQFPDFPAAEWVVRFKNTGVTDSPILQNVRALDFEWEANDVDILLHRSRGSHGQIEDFLLQTEPLYRKDTFAETQNVIMTAGQGRSSQDWLPFFNVQTGNEGFFAAIGWSGEWKAEFLCSDDTGMHVNFGMERTHLKLHPGEEIRTPRVLLLFWEGATPDAHNLLRRFLLKYHTPHVDGAPAQMPICSATWGGVKTASHLKALDLYKEHGLDYDCYWVDAGWYGQGDTDCPDVFIGDWASQTGNWNINRYRHPDGLRPIGEAAHQSDMTFLLWFELQRAIVGTNLPAEHPDWFFPRQNEKGELLLNIGHPEALQWCIETVSNYIESEGIDIYRQDFNIDPLEFWRAEEETERQGIAEIRNIEALYTFWDELRRRHPRLLIDNCASGGRCLDLETIGRSIPLWRSDFQCFAGANPIGLQVQFVGLSHWLPIHAGGTMLDTLGDTYAFRSAISAGISDQLTMFESKLPQNSEQWAWASQRLREQKRLRPYMSGDFYALTKPSVSPEVWCVYQMYQGEEVAGFVMAFRREDSPFPVGSFQLKGLDPDRSYTLEDLDSGQVWTACGRDLLEVGLHLELETPRSSKIICFR